MKKILIRFAIGVVLILFVLYLIGRSIPQKEVPTADSVTKVEGLKIPLRKDKDTLQAKPIYYNSLKYPLSGSDYVYNVEITSIETKIAKGTFTTKKDDYSVPQDADGYYLKIKFSLTNPYEQEMMVPIPNYFYISSTNKEFFSGSTTYSKSCSCQINNSTDVFNDKGKELWQFSEGKCGHSSYCVHFKPKETKNYILKFNDPIFGEVKRLWFWGFNRHWEREGSTSRRDLALIIDVDEGMVIGEEKL